MDDEEIEMLKYYFTEAVKFWKHVQFHLRDRGPREELEFAKASVARRTALLRLGAGQIGVDQLCLRLLYTIEK